MIQNPKTGLRDANPKFPSLVAPAKAEIILSGSSRVSFFTKWPPNLVIVSDFLVYSVHGLQKTTTELLYRKLRIITTTYCLSKFSVVLEYSRFDRQSGKCRMVDSDLILICSYFHSLKNRFNFLLNVLNYSAGPGRISSPSDCKVCGIHTSAVQIRTPLLQILYIQNTLEVRKFESTELER